MGAHPPSGTVTFLLTDLEGSTRLWEQDPERERSRGANVDPKFLRGRIIVGTESTADV